MATMEASIEIAELRTAADTRAFVRFPWSVQATDPAWVPPLVMDRKDFLNRKKHPFFDHGDATLLLARRRGKVVGRILVSDDPRYNETHGTNLGCFGMFEAVDEQEVANALLDAATVWLRSKGRDSMLGPIDYSTNYQCGLLVEGFDSPPRIMMNHNPRYYPVLLERWGLQKVKDLWTWWITREQEPPQRWRRISVLAQKRYGYTIRPLNMKDFDAEVQRIKRIYNDAWEDNWGFVKMTEHEFDHLAKDLKLVMKPGLFLIAEVDGEAIGFSMSLPDINEALVHLPNGRLTTLGLPIGLGKLLYHQRKIQTVRLLTLGVLSKYRRRGVTEAMILRTYDEGKKLGYTGCEMGWTLEDNHLINAPIEAIGSKRHKTYRLYERAI
ncbi:MAG: GNAT family N-acetyltransferase [Nannocystaceae bacterium]